MYGKVQRGKTEGRNDVIILQFQKAIIAGFHSKRGDIYLLPPLQKQICSETSQSNRELGPGGMVGDGWAAGKGNG